jgi:tripartite-type tricarboxylate transporter receptor subunit TctC
MRFLLALIALFSSLVEASQAQSAYPNRPVTIVVGFSAGGTTDIVARLVADELRKAWGQSVVIENKPGATGMIGAEHVARSRPDGYTLLVGSVGPMAINASLFPKVPYDNLKDFTPIVLLVHVPNMLVVNPASLPVKSFDEFVTALKAKPGKYFFASTGTGTSSHLSGEMLNVMGGVQATHVPYKGAVALNDLLAGDQVQFMFATIPSVIQHVRSGRLRALAVTSLTRSAAVPEVPAVAEFGFPEFEASSWMGLFGPRDLPREIVDKISTDVARIVKTPDIRERLTQQGADPAGTGPDEFAAYVRAETTRWARVVRTSGAKPE